VIRASKLTELDIISCSAFKLWICEIK